METLKKLFTFFKELIANRFTGQIRINMHEGNISKDVTKKGKVRI